MSKGNYRTSTVNERWGGGGGFHTFITRPYGDQVNINILLFQCDTTKILQSPRPRPPSYLKQGFE